MTAGVYALRHCRKRLVYVGASLDLEQRWRGWSAVLAAVEKGATSYGTFRLSKLMFGTRRCDWQFVVLEELPAGVSRPALRKRERAQIARARSLFADGCLNVSDVARPLRFVKGSLDG